MNQSHLQTSIQIENRPFLSDAEAKNILTTLPAIEEVRIIACPQLGEATIQFISALPIRSLYWVGNLGVSSQNYRFLQRLEKTLTSLNVSGSIGFDQEACSTLVQTCGQLRSLDASFCPLGPHSFRSARAPLQFLNLEGCRDLSDDTLADLAQIPTLRHLFLAQNPLFTQRGLSLLQSLPLKTLSIRGAWNLCRLSV